jgi:hypothetical protein
VQHVAGFAVHDVSREYGTIILHIIKEFKNKASGAQEPCKTSDNEILPGLLDCYLTRHYVPLKHHKTAAHSRTLIKVET